MKDLRTNQLGANYVDLVRGLDNIARCCTLPVNRPQSVSEHSFHVAQLALVASADLIDAQVPHNDLFLLQLALMHDVEEAIIGDVIYPVKNASPAMKQEYNNLRHGLAETFTAGAPSSTIQHFIWRFLGTDSDTLEGQVLNICDMLELALYLGNEMMRGNRHPEIKRVMLYAMELVKVMPQWEHLKTFHHIHGKLRGVVRDYGV